MSENVPPASAGKAGNASDRGIPYYEKLRRDLRDTINKKRVLDRNMAAVEAEIFRLETSYLEETSSAGNIVKGFDNYIKAATTTTATSVNSGTIPGSATGGRNRRGVINDADRVFSKSSMSYNRDSDSPGIGSAVSTPGASGTPTGSFAAETRADKKKKKAAANNDEDDARSTKRQKISFPAGSRKGQDD